MLYVHHISKYTPLVFYCHCSTQSCR